MGDASPGEDVEEYAEMLLPSISKQIKNILNEYPDDGQIIKELVQNADDAGASEMKILYEGRDLNLPQEGDGHLKKFFKAPALAIYNNAEFTTNDWKGIRMLGDSVKAEDPLKVGRFGLGFKSVFHMTDYPCIISDDRIVFINPLEKDFHRVLTFISLKKLGSSKHVDVKDCLKSLQRTFGFSKKTLSEGKFYGTLFWFPLRDSPSELSPNIYTEGKVLDLIHAFMAESHQMLLFLKHLKRVKWYANLAKPDNPQMASDTMDSYNLGKTDEFYTLEIVNDNYLQDRCSFIERLERLRFASGLPDETVEFCQEAVVRTKKMQDSTEYKYFVTHYLMGKGKVSANLLRLVEEKDISSIPLVGIAAPLCGRSMEETKRKNGGHVFCFQPLPQVSHSLTRLPVHVNALFALSQNRRHLKWPSEDQMELKNHVDKFIEWNLTLINEVLPEAYFELVKNFVSFSARNNNATAVLDAVYGAIPFQTDEKWEPLVDPLLDKLIEEDILFTENNSGMWIQPPDAVIAPEMNEVSDQDPLRSVFALLRLDNINLVHIPKNLCDALQSKAEIKEVNPDYVARHLREHDAYKKLEKEQKEDVLLYLCRKGNDSLLNGLELLPLADGSFTSFLGEEDILEIFVEPSSIVDLFPGLEMRFVSNDVSNATSKVFARLRKNEQYQMRHMSWGTLIPLLESTIRHSFGQVSYIAPGQLDGHIWSSNEEMLWELISKLFDEDSSLNIMERFKALPLFPLKSGDCSESSLNNLGEIYIIGDERHGLNDQVADAFVSLGCHVIAKVPKYVAEGIKLMFFHDCSSESVDSLMLRLNKKIIDAFNESSKPHPAGQPHALLSFLSSRLRERHTLRSTDVLRKLRIWNQFASIDSPDSELVSLAQNEDIFIDDHFPIPFPEPLIITKETAIAKLIGAKETSKKDVTIRTLKQIDKFSEDHKHTFMIWLLKKKKLLQDEQVKQLANEIKFVRAGDGHFYKASDLFDPMDSQLKEIFSIDGEGFLPADSAVLEGDCLQGLRSLGLRGQDSVKLDDVLRLCKVISRLQDREAASSLENVNALLRLMNNRSDLLDKTVLGNIPFMHVWGKRDATYPSSLPYYNEEVVSSLLSPVQVKSMEFAFLIGSSYPLFDCTAVPNVANCFGWTVLPPTEAVLDHLTVISRTYSPSVKSQYLSMITQIYEWLDKTCDLRTVKRYIDKKYEEEQIGCLWTGDGFDVAESIVVKFSSTELNLAPFLNRIAPEHTHLEKFFIALGCIEKRTLDTYVKTLNRIKDASEKSNNQINNDDMRNMAISILNLIKHDDLLSYSIYVPIQTCENSDMQMKEASQCTYCDADWLQDDEEELVYVHSDVPISTAEAVGVKSLTEQSLSESEGIEEWGQSEPLTRRLRNLLKHSYVDGFTVPKELFQNADDAGATTMSILYDERENEDCRNNLLSPNMTDLQGPAIWIYNDAEFTESDFLNITKLNGATKEKDSSKIGKFGLGFCAVYNITDVPSILSRDKIVIFDPHTTFLGKALPGRSPGLKIDFSKLKNQKIMKKCINQFQPYEGVFDCHIINNRQPLYKGTLFRFPLRIRESEISDTIYSRVEVSELLQKIVMFSGNMFIFAQHLKKLKILHLPRTAKFPSDAKLFFETTQRRKSEFSPLDPAVSILREASKMKRNGELQGAPLRVVDKVLISTKIQHSNTDLLKPAATRGKNNSKTSWLVAWSSGTDSKTWTLANGERGALPLGAVAVPVNKETNAILKMTDLPDGFYKNSHVFFFLPLPITHDLSFHINGPFAVTNDRRHLYRTSEDDKDSKMKEWNDCLLQDAIVASLLCLLQTMKRIYCKGMYKFYELWPLEECADVSSTITKSFYQKVVSGSYDVFESDEKWLNISQCLFLDPEMRRQSPEIARLALEVVRHTEKEKTIVDIPTQYYDQLVKVKHDKIKEITISKNEFLLEYFLPNLDKCLEFLPVDERNLILAFAIKLHDGEINAWLQQNDSIPTKPSGKLICPKRLIQPGSRVAALFSEEDMRFPIDQFINNMQTELIKLGMRDNDIEHDDVLERAKTVAMLNERCCGCANDRQEQFVKYMSEQRQVDLKTYGELKSIAFIPVMEKPKKWPFAWKFEPMKRTTSTMIGNSECIRHTNETGATVFLCPTSLYLAERRHLVGCLHLVAKQHGVGTDFGQLNSFERCIGIQSNVSTKSLIDQLKLLTESYVPIPRADGSNIIKAVYDELDKRCRTDQDIITKELEDKCVVFIDGKFEYTKKFAKRMSYDCPPYLFSLTRSPLRFHETLCKCLNIQDFFSSESVTAILSNIHGCQGSEPLDKVQLGNILTLLRCLFENIEREKNEFKHYVGTLYIPDETGSLREATTLCFNDGYDELQKGHDMVFAHNRISPALAKAFGVMPKLRRHIVNSSDDIEDFYQEEPLVRRINNLLEGYPCDISIFKELLQNADDAGATEVHFVNDTTHHGTRHIIDPSFSVLQGPALCVFNDSTFSNEDLKGITQLGKGSKCDDPVKTGQYGVGFNAVYNLTDVPSFLTKGSDMDTLCIFDPLEKHVPDVSRGKPGKRYKDVDLLRTHVQDMMSGYHEGKLMKEGKGTIFRFPLRKKESEISKTSMSSEEMSNLLVLLVRELPDMLIFLKSLEKVRISTFVGDRLEEVCCIETQLAKDGISERKRFVTAYKKMYSDVKADRQTMFKGSVNESVMYTLNVVQNHKPLKTYQVVQTVGFKDPEQTPSVVEDAVKNHTIGLFPIGGVALCVDNKETTQHAPSKSSKVFCFLPLPEETGLPMHVNGHFALDHETRRGLWRPENVRGDKCEKFQWNTTLIKQVIMPSFVKVLKQRKRELFAKKENQWTEFKPLMEIIYQYENMFPSDGDVTDSYWKGLLESMFKFLIETYVDFLPCFKQRTLYQKQVYLTWTSLKLQNSEFFAFHHPVDDEKNVDVLPILSDIGMRVFSVSDTLCKAIQYAGYEIKEVAPRAVIDFLRSYSSSDEGSCTVCVSVSVVETSLKSIENVRTLTRYCSSEKGYFQEQITKLPLVVTHDEQLRQVNKGETVFVTEFVNLFQSVPTLHSRFLNVYLYREYQSLCGCHGGAFKRFDIPDFVQTCCETRLYNVCDGKAMPWDKKEPSVEWVRNVLDFTMEHVELNMEECVKEKISQIGSLSLLPVVTGNSCFLYPGNKINHVLSSDLRGNSSLKMVLSRCQIPTLDRAVFDSNTQRIHVCSVVPDFGNPTAFVDCLLNNIELLHSAQLTLQEARTLLAYVSSNIGKFNKQSDVVSLKRLPMYISSNEKPVRIDSVRQVVVFPDDQFPHCGLRNLKDTLFLEEIPEALPLYQFLGLSVRSVVETYTDIIFQGHGKMSRSDFYKHVQFVLKYCVGRPRDLDIVCVKLKTLAFVHEPFREVQELFNPNRRIFGEFCTEEELLPEELRSFKLICTFVDKLGLQNKMTLALFERFAKAISSSETSIGKDVRRRSSMLCEELLSMDKQFIQHNNFQNLIKIKFLVAESVKENLSSLCPSFKENLLTNFTESVLFSKGALCWTSSCLLPKCVDKCLRERREKDELGAKMIVKQLSINCTPPVDVFVQHCKKLGESTAIKMKEKKERLYNCLWKEIYNAFRDYKAEGTISECEDLKPLQNVPLIYLQDRNLLVPAVAVINDCSEEDEIPPHLYRAPIKFGEYHDDVFCLLGTSKKRSVGNYARVLRCLFETTASRKMLPPEKMLAVKATKHLITCLKSGLCDNEEACLFLPSAIGTLEPVKSIVVSDSMYLFRRLRDNLPSNLKYFIQFEALEEKPETVVECLKKFSDSLQQPLLLSSLVNEAVRKSYLRHESQREASEIRVFLHSQAFIDGYSRLVKNNFKGTESEWEKNASQLKTMIKQIELSHVSGLTTVLEVRNFRDGQYTDYKPVEGTEEESAIHKDKEGERVIFSFQTNDESWYSNVRDKVAEHIADNLPGDRTLNREEFTLTCQMLDFRRKPQEISSLLDKHKVKMYTAKPEAREEALPKVGTFVPTEYHKYLDNSFGEIDEIHFQCVAYELDDDEEETKMDVDDEDTFPTYVFARILCKKESTSSNVLFQTYEVDIGEPTTKDVPSYRLYVFKRDNSVDEDNAEGMAVAVFKQREGQPQPQSREQREGQPKPQSREQREGQPEPQSREQREGQPGPQSREQREGQPKPHSRVKVDLKEAYKEVREHLKEAWKLSEKERKSIVKRLFLNWHPDKNKDNEGFCTKVFQYIQQCLKRLEEGKDLPSDTEDNGDDKGRRKWDSSGQGTSGGGFDDWFKSDPTYGSFYRNWGRYNHGSSFRPSSFSFSDAEYKPFRYPVAAKRWLRQAKADMFHATKIMEEMTMPCYNWVCYMCHQAAEKSLTAAWYAKDANKIHGKKYNHNLNAVAIGLSSNVNTLCSQLTSLVGEYNLMRYPGDSSVSDMTANERFSWSTANKAMDLAKRVIDEVETTYNLRT